MKLDLVQTPSVLLVPFPRQHVSAQYNKKTWKCTSMQFRLVVVPFHSLLKDWTWARIPTIPTVSCTAIQIQLFCTTSGMKTLKAVCSDSAFLTKDKWWRERGEENELDHLTEGQDSANRTGKHFRNVPRATDIILLQWKCKMLTNHNWPFL
jgi:hypothetical protein